MKKLVILFTFSMLLLFTSCKGQDSSNVIEVMPAQEFHDATAGNDVQLLDVRTSKEYKEGHVAQALNIDVLEDDFSEKAKSLDKDQPVYLYCRSGNRSKKASAILKDMGFKEIYDMEGGFLKWEDEGLESEK
ncbi:rhodanese-like domain-containing protein [Aequorivita capsosiphonis]|uniref:rhodanese-like domain-containing protein n=1 Tax=Aequorivita capsosiphonis TaxID=487317 RepID=UPI000478ABE1|nr:rhodanese-like domain-containing protein [Aequorivita capsosiphonis]